MPRLKNCGEQYRWCNQSGQPRHFLDQKHAVSECRAPSENLPLLQGIQFLIQSRIVRRTVSWVCGNFKYIFKLPSVTVSQLPTKNLVDVHVFGMAFPKTGPYPLQVIGTPVSLMRSQRQRTDRSDLGGLENDECSWRRRPLSTLHWGSLCPLGKTRGFEPWFPCCRRSEFLIACH